MEVLWVTPLVEVNQTSRGVPYGVNWRCEFRLAIRRLGWRPGCVSGVVLLLLLLRSGCEPSGAPLQWMGARLPGCEPGWVGFSEVPGHVVGVLRPRFRPYFLRGNGGYTLVRITVFR